MSSSRQDQTPLFSELPHSDPGDRVSRLASACASALCSLLSTSLAAQTVQVKETRPGLLAKATISADSAVALARSRVPNAKVAAGEIEIENGKLIYSFDMKTDGKSGIDEVNVDARSGKVLSVAHESFDEEAKEAKSESKTATKSKPAAKKPPR